MQSFIFGGRGMPQTPQELARRREIAEALAQGAVGRAPRDVGEGLGAIGKALAFRAMERRNERAAAAGQESAQGAFAPIAAALSPGSFPPAPAAPGGGGMAAEPMDRASMRVAQAHGDQPAGGMEAYRNAIASVESGGRYDIVGPTHPKLGRALGKYQVMEANVGPWTQKHLGKAMTAEEFLANPQAQDAVFDGEFGSYVQKFGDPAMAAQAWFAGPGGVGTNRKDSLGTSVPAYAAKFNAALGQQPSQAALESLPVGGSMPVGQAPAPQQMAQADPQNSTTMGAPPMQAGGPMIEALMQAASNPWLSESQQKIVQALLGQQMAERDPMTAMERRKMELELKALENPQGDPFTLSEGQIRFDAQGKPIAKGGEKEPNLPSAVLEYEYAKKQGFPGTFQDWESSKKGGMSLQVDPATGQVTFQQGANIKPLTEGQSKDTVYATRAEGALPLIDQFGEALTGLGESVAGQVPIVGNYAKSPEYQKAEQAGAEFLQAILRKDTGAAITSQEMAEYGMVYLPRPGDSPEVLAQKRTSRMRALEAIKAGMPPQAILQQEKALQNTGAEAPAGDDADLDKLLEMYGD